jgi:excisionase family DNA binding protein
MAERLAYTKAEAADALGVSVDYLEDHVLAHVKVVRRGRKVLIPVSELQRWLEENSALTLASVA